MLKPLKPHLLRMFPVIRQWPKKCAIGFVKGYRYFVSPLMAHNCRFYPTCSSYGIEALETYGFLKGCLLTTKRLLRCHPWHRGGHDPVPKSQCRSHRMKSDHQTYHKESLVRTSWICKEHS